jgi:hypothetical protein
MPDDNKDHGIPLDNGDTNTDGQIAALLRDIQQEMDAMTPEELERLYAAIALMEMHKDK